ncbi:MAG: hypothetical protein COV60_03190, partial [Candidatus Magasanikbacteria bacterium CG11_big_fil_rev_8_21_14_0_20_43_7]
MIQHIKTYISQEQKAHVLLLSIVATVVGISLSLFFIMRANAAVSSVTGSDLDTTKNGLSGADVQIAIDVDANTPAGFEFMKVFIVSSTASLTTGTLNTACDGVCQERGFFSQHADITYALPDFMNTDSSGAAWVTTTPYVIWVYTSSTVPTIVSSSPFSLLSDTVDDNNAPFVNHTSVHSAVQNAAATIYAGVMDDQTTREQFSTTTGNQYFVLYYGADVSVSQTAVTGTWTQTSDFFSFSIPTTTVGAAGNTFEYYLVAQDAASNIRYFCANPSAASVNDCKTSPFLVTSIASGSRTVSGTITSAGSPLGDTVVMAGGFSIPVAVTNGDGAYTLSGLPNNTSVDITVVKNGYCDNKRFETIGTTNLTDIDLSLNAGNCGFFGGEDGGQSPHVTFSFPFEGSNNIPPDTIIKIGVDKSLNASSVNDNNASDSGSSVYLTIDGSTKLAGSVIYCASNSDPGCSSLPSGDSNVILYTPGSAMTTSTFYTLVIREGVVSENGKSIEGNRAGGGHQISFFTGGGTVSFGGEGGPTFGNGGQYMPPFVRAMHPGPGQSIASDSSILLEFNEALNDAT